MPTINPKRKLKTIGHLLAGLLVVTLLWTPSMAYAGKVCGQGESKTTTSIDIGCKGKGNSITDATFAVIRFLTNGVGVVLVASTVYGGIQYTASRGDPKGTADAINRIRANVIALLLFAFAYAILNYLIPGQILR